MSAYQTTIKSALLCLAVSTLSSCAGGRTAGEHVPDMPHWMGGLPADAPPPNGLVSPPRWGRFSFGCRRAELPARPDRPSIAHARPHPLPQSGSARRMLACVYGDLRVGPIAIRTGIPPHEDPWGRVCGF